MSVESKPWWRQPLFHFFLAGAALFLADTYLTDGPAHSSRTIEVGPEKLRELASRFERRHGRKPTGEERSTLVDSYVRDEVLYREALELGLHRSDRIVRRRLIQAMTFLTEDMNPIPEPTDAELHSFFEKHRSRYTSEATYSFRHVFFPEKGFPNESSAKTEVLQKLRGGEWKSIGRPFIHGSTFDGLKRDAIAEKFGGAFADRIAEIAEGEWSGPVESSYGNHFLYVESKSEAGRAAFANVRDRVRRDYREADRKRENREAIERLREEYDVVVQTSRGGDDS